MKVGVLDYGVGNLGSVLRALDELRASPLLLQRAGDLHLADCLVLPGVGSFTECKKRLDDGGWTAALTDAVLCQHKPLLGICLGMQLLADRGLEGAGADEATPGLGFIPGQVHSLASLGCTGRLPHMGWNAVTATPSAASPATPTGLLQHIPDGTDFYFVHSYALVPRHASDLLATCDYGGPVAAVVGRGRVFGTQFHPEKSGRAGFRLLRNFLDGAAC